MAQCFACRKKTSRYDDVIICTNKSCGKVFHPKCINEEFTDLNRSGLLAQWLCDDCHNSDEVPSVSNDKLDFLISRVNVIYNKVNDIDFKALISSVRQLEDVVQSLKTDLSKKNEEIIELKKQHEEDRKHLLGKVNDLEFFTKKKNIIITGIPYEREEKLRQTFKGVQNVIKANIADDDIVDIHRIYPGGPARADLGKPPPIIVAFKNTDIKNEFMQKKKSMKKAMTTIEIGFPGPPQRIFFNDQLTEQGAILFRKARARKSAGELAHVWTDGGKILVRKTDGGRVYRIQREEDFPA